MVRSQNPYTEEVLKEFSYLNADELSIKLKAAAAAFEVYRKLSFKDREQVCLTIGQELKKNTEVLAEWITKETGKPIRDSRAEVEKCATCFAVYPEVLSSSANPEQSISGNYDEVIIQRLPAGAVLCIMPWNYPLWQLTRVLVANLISGNITLLKHSEVTWATADAFCDVLAKATQSLNLPKLLFHLRIPESDIEQVLKSSLVCGVSFTGSVRGGRAVASLAGKYLKKCVLELGGSDPYLLLPDADLKKCSSILMQARLTNLGQACISAKRIFVPAPFQDDLARLLAVEIQEMKFGDPLSEDTQLGTLAHEKFALQLSQQVRELQRYGGRIVFEHSPDLRSQAHHPVQIVLMPKWVPELRDMELFGPVFVIYEYQNLDQAIECANDTNFGLGAAVFSEDERKAKEVGSRLNCGVLAINDFIRTDARVPFGGTRDSGYGRELGLLGAFEFVNHRSVLVSRK